MSERSKGDTSSSVAAPPASARVVKNPLLSASVTGLTFDDFQNKPVLLPAAPPIIHTVPVVSSRESTPLVTVGKSSEIDSENLSEVNLNDFSTATTSTVDTSDENSNSLLEPTISADNSILSQAASSFSQLPSVASSVFSTFSKKFNAASGRDDINSNPAPQLDIQPFSTSYVSQSQQPIQPPPTAFASSEQQHSTPPSEPQTPVEPPTFYSPTDVQSAPIGAALPPPAAGQNTYRISARKKIYAPIPGLSAAHQEQNFPPTTSTFLPPVGFEASPVPVYAEQASSQPEQRKGGGLFSLSNLVPGVPSVFQNLSGLVQSATGSLTQKPPSQPQSVDSFGAFQVETSGQPPSAYYPPAGPVDFFGQPTHQPQVHPHKPPDFFAPPVTAAAISPEPTASSVPVSATTTLAKPLSRPPSSTGILPAGLAPKQSTSDVKPTIDQPPNTFGHSPAPQVPGKQESPPKTGSPSVVPDFTPIQPEQRPPSTGSYFAGQRSLNSAAAPPAVGQSPSPAPQVSVPQNPSVGNFFSSAAPDSTLASSIQTTSRPPSTEAYFGGQLSLNSAASPPTASQPPAPKGTVKQAPLAGNFFSSVVPDSTFASSNQTTPRPPSTGAYFGGQPPLNSAAQSLTIAQPPPPAPQGLFKQDPPIGNFFSSIPPKSGLPSAVPDSTFASSIQTTPRPPSIGASIGGQPPLTNTPPLQQSSLPPQFKPPSGAPSTSSFRLQKGTRLYKSPFVVAPSDFTQQPASGYSLGGPPGPSLPQGFATPQGTFPPLPPPTAQFSATVLTPTQSSPVPGSVPLQNLSSNQQPDTFAERPTTQSTPPFEYHRPTAPPLESTAIAAANAFKADNSVKQETLNLFQTNNAQSTQLPPPPVAASETGSQSRETANFPPPPPQNSIQNNPSSNPYRRGLQSHHSPLPIAASASAFFTPSDQDSGLFKPSTTEFVKPTPSQLPDSTIFTPSGQSSNQFEPIASVSTATTFNLTNQEPTFYRPIEAEQTDSPAASEPLLTTFSSSDQDLQTKTVASEPVDPATTSASEELRTSTPNEPISTPLKTIDREPAEPALVNDTKVSAEESSNFQPIATKPLNPQPTLDSVSLTFAASGQPTNLFKPIPTEPVNPSPFSAFFSAAPELQVQTAASVFQPYSQPSPITSNTFSPIPAPASFSSTPPSLIEAKQQPTTVSSFFATEAPVSKPSVTRTPPTAANFFNSSTPPLRDPFSAAYTKELLIGSEQEANTEPSKPVATEPQAPVKIASPSKSQENTESQQSVPNLFSSFFQPTTTAVTPVEPVVNQAPSLPDPTSFFDSITPVPSVGVEAPPPEDPNSQRIQNFFNNPPPKDLDPVGDLNYTLVGSGLSVKNLQIRSLTPASNLAEPPSSSCSEFSELNSSLSAANRQPRVPAEDSTKVSPEEEAVFEAPDNQDLSEEIINELKMANIVLDNNTPVSPTSMVYTPAVKHWFYKRKIDAKNVWTPFSYLDSALIEDGFLNASNEVAVEGGRYDVNISERIKVPVYWEGEPIEVKRCSWFFKASDSKYVPYEEEIADLLEEEYRKASESCEWHKKIPISAGDMVVFHGPTVIVHFQQQQQVDSWGGSTQTTTRPRVVKRDLEDFTIEEGESHKVDHLLYMVHGIGSACDLKMRSVEEVVDEFRAIAFQLVQSHYKNSVENGYVGRVEVLPVSWHSELHSDELGIDEKLKSITLESIPKLRNFTNDTLLDILFYTSPMFCQRIMNHVTASMNSIYIKYKQRHPDFDGGISLAGHSLGSLILFDLLCHQRPHKENEDQNMENPDEITPGFPVDSNQLNEDAAKHISYKMGPAGTGQPFISYPQLIFQPRTFFALGSPIGMFVTIRGIDKLGLDFRLPTCQGFFNIFHPYDPVAYRLEALVNPDMNGIPPVLIPHHKGRKRMHLELKETMTRVGADLKQRFFDTFKTTFDTVSFLNPKPKPDAKEMEREINKVLELQASQESQPGPSTRSRLDSNSSTTHSDIDIVEIDLPLGKLNDSRRVDYVLQEAPLEFFNEYLFALSSHVCYWESSDTILFVMKEIYSGIGFSPDSQVPQQTMTIERPSSSGSVTQSPTR